MTHANQIITNHAQTIQSHQKKINQLNTQISDTKQIKTTIKGNSKTKTKRRNQLQTQIDNCQNHRRHLTSEIEQIQKDIQKLEDNLIQLGKTLNKLKQKLRTLENNKKLMNEAESKKIT